MIKVGIVTVHRCFNYGACLQAYATVWFLRKQGYDAEIIDYTNDYEQRFLKLSYKENERLLGYVTSLLKNLILRKNKYYKMGLGKVSEMYPLSKQRYRSITELSNVQYDVLVSGSDQIWNPCITNGLDSVFFLEFGHAKKRISIASSIGSSELTTEDKDIIRNALKAYSAISVREQYAKDQIQQLTSKEICVISDPTLLFKKSDWDTLIEKSKYSKVKERYILTYFVSPQKHNNDYQQRVKEYAEKYQLPIWTIQFGGYRWKISSKRILGASMEDFLSLIANSSFVITDSYHGVVLSAILNKDFIAFKHVDNPIRTEEFLKDLGLETRMNMKPKDYCPINYTRVNRILENKRIHASNWIRNVIEMNEI